MNNEITDDMVKFFYKRTNNHINAVSVFAKRIYRDEELRKFIDAEKFFHDIANHDQSKFEEPELTPYIKLTWRKNYNKKDYQQPGTIDHADENMATLAHITSNQHHPEYWSDQKENLLNIKDRDKPSGTIIDATKMPLTYIASMVADWMAMSKELENSPYIWAKNNINIRWKFNKEQIEFIYLILERIWNK